MLVEEGYDKENIERICTPIGLKIGAVTPEEIAVSILSEIIAYKRLPEKNTGHSRYVNGSDLDLEMIEYLAETRTESCRHRNSGKRIYAERRRCKDGRGPERPSDGKYRRRLQ